MPAAEAFESHQPRGAPALEEPPFVPGATKTPPGYKVGPTGQLVRVDPRDHRGRQAAEAAMLRHASPLRGGGASRF